MITLPTTITEPAKTYDTGLITRLEILASSPTAGRVFLEVTPINSATNEKAPATLAQRFVCNDLFKAIAEVPEMAAAYAAVLAAVPPMMAWTAAQNAPTDNE